MNLGGLAPELARARQQSMHGLERQRLQQQSELVQQKARQLVSYGPCQTPTLAHVVWRWDDIQRFVPQKFCVLHASLRAGPRVLRLKSKNFLTPS